MRIRISHHVASTFERPVRSVMQALRVMPRDHEGQIVVSWRIEPSVDGRLRVDEDAFGNLVHQFQADGPFDELALRIEGLVETTDTTGFLRGGACHVPDQVFLRNTALTQPDEGLALFARKLARGSELEQLHALMQAIHTEFSAEVSQPEQPQRASAAFAIRKGDAAALAHVFCGAARELGVPARVAAGYLATDGDDGRFAGRHVWAEAAVEGYGWIAFDPSLNLCPSDRHVRVAIGIDGADAAPFRQSCVGGGGEAARSIVTAVPLDQ